MSQSPGVSIADVEAKKWFEEEAWKNGLEMDAHPTTDINEFYRQYHANKSGWEQAFAFLKNQDLENMQPGKYPVDGDNVYASVNEAPNMEFDKTAWESHRKYNDIQYLIKGEETIGITDASTATVTVDYDEKQDIIFYKAEGPAYPFRPGVFFIFFPGDLHRPGIKVSGSDMVKKIVLKIRTAS